MAIILFPLLASIIGLFNRITGKIMACVLIYLVCLVLFYLQFNKCHIIYRKYCFIL